MEMYKLQLGSGDRQQYVAKYTKGALKDKITWHILKWKRCQANHAYNPALEKNII